jgi:ribosomal protein L34E
MEIHGVPRARQAEVRNTTKSQRRPNRMYGGHYSHKAVKDAIRKTVLKEMNVSADINAINAAADEE